LRLQHGNIDFRNGHYNAKVNEEFEVQYDNYPICASQGFDLFSYATAKGYIKYNVFRDVKKTSTGQDVEEGYAYSQREIERIIEAVDRVSGREEYSATMAGMEGWPSALNSGLEVLLALRKNKKGYVSPRDIALLYANLGDSDHAFEWLNIACEEHDVFLPDLPINPQFDSLRSDPRYPDLLRKIGFLQ